MCSGPDGKKLNFINNLFFLSQYLNAEEWSPRSSTDAKSFVPWEHNSFAFANPEQQYVEHPETETKSPDKEKCTAKQKQHWSNQCH